MGARPDFVTPVAVYPTLIRTYQINPSKVYMSMSATDSHTARRDCKTPSQN